MLVWWQGLSKAMSQLTHAFYIHLFLFIKEAAQGQKTYKK